MYHHYLSEVVEAEKREKTDNTRKILEREIEETKVKHEQPVTTCEMLDFVIYVEEAEKKQGMKLISKANALKRISEEKKEDIKKLEEAIGVLEEKRKRTKSTKLKWIMTNYFSELIFTVMPIIKCTRPIHFSFTT